MSLQAYWYPLCRSRDLKTPVKRRLLGRSLVLYRAEDGVAHALEDRCRHRNAPLSKGKVVGCAIQCPYHGWEFDGDGACSKIPGLEGFIGRKRVAFHAVREQNDLVWVYGEANVAAQDAEDAPLELPMYGEPGYRSGVIDFGSLECTMQNMLENFMDTMHPAFIHPGMFYTEERQPLRVHVARYQCEGSLGKGIEADFLDEPSPTQGLLGRLFAEKDAEIYHRERFLVPTFHQLEYRIGKKTHIITSQLVIPEEERKVRLLVAYSVRLRFPATLIAPLFPRYIRKTILEDMAILRDQEQVLEDFGEARYSSTRLDALAVAMMTLLSRLQTGKRFEELEVKPVQYRALV